MEPEFEIFNKDFCEAITAFIKTEHRFPSKDEFARIRKETMPVKSSPLDEFFKSPFIVPNTTNAIRVTPSWKDVSDEYQQQTYVTWEPTSSAELAWEPPTSALLSTKGTNRHNVDRHWVSAIRHEGQYDGCPHKGRYI